MDTQFYDVIVIGAGHAGIEAALVSARMGCQTAIFTMNMDAVGNCPCNPSIGGTAKGHLVREIDALGGEMGKTADASLIQSRMLNTGKGPAVHSLRAQIDRREYSKIMKHKLELQENLVLRQAEIIELERLDNTFWKVKTRTKIVYQSKAVIIASGTYLNSHIYVGDMHYESGPDGMFPALFLAKSLKTLGLRMQRFKTGTPARVLRSSIDFRELEEQEGNDPIVPFSFETEEKLYNQAVCYVTWTNSETKRVILENIHTSPLYSGKIAGIGPRYCPSIEDKMIRFEEKEKHQIFIEPCGMNTEEMYLQGLSSSLSEEVQLQFYHTIKGFENLQIMRCAYAIEYDCVDPLQMKSNLEFSEFPGLYGAGQFNGSSGYEEAAAQGLVAGINAVLRIQGKPPLLLDRASSYIGTLIDDLITKGVSDPYRMMTSRSEYRLILRQDNADERLKPIGRGLGLISDRCWKKFQKKQEQKKQELERVRKTVLPPSEQLNQILILRETSEVTKEVRLIDLLKRPELNYIILKEIDTKRPNLPDSVFENVEIGIKYEGYIAKQKADIKDMRRLEKRILPKMDYKQISGLRIEAQEKLEKVQPTNIGQASRISGVSPADISVLLIWLTKVEQEHDKKQS